jgi:cold shock CspA family protein
MITGEIRHFDEGKKFGFIRGDDGEDYFFHGGSLSPRMQRISGLLREGYRVKFDTDFDMKGNKAVNVQPG